jgi:hypothetical protein
MSLVCSSGQNSCPAQLPFLAPLPHNKSTCLHHQSCTVVMLTLTGATGATLQQAAQDDSMAQLWQWTHPIGCKSLIWTVSSHFNAFPAILPARRLLCNCKASLLSSATCHPPAAMAAATCHRQRCVNTNTIVLGTQFAQQRTPAATDR